MEIEIQQVLEQQPGKIRAEEYRILSLKKQLLDVKEEQRKAEAITTREVRILSMDPEKKKDLANAELREAKVKEILDGDSLYLQREIRMRSLSEDIAVAEIELNYQKRLVESAYALAVWRRVE